MKINMIMAHSMNRVIGYRGKIPWKCPEDTVHFKETTMGTAVIMGRATWLSLPEKARPLPGRVNIVMSKTLAQVGIPGAIVCASVNAVFNVLENLAVAEAWVIGGEKVYRMFMPLVDKVVATEIQEVHTGDAWAPHLVPGVYQVYMGATRYSVVGKLAYRVITSEREPRAVEKSREQYRLMRV